MRLSSLLARKPARSRRNRGSLMATGPRRSVRRWLPLAVRNRRAILRVGRTFRLLHAAAPSAVGYRPSRTNNRCNGSDALDRPEKATDLSHAEVCGRRLSRSGDTVSFTPRRSVHLSYDPRATGWFRCLVAIGRIYAVGETLTDRRMTSCDELHCSANASCQLERNVLSFANGADCDRRLRAQRHHAAAGHIGFAPQYLLRPGEQPLSRRQDPSAISPGNSVTVRLERRPHHRVETVQRLAGGIHRSLLHRLCRRAPAPRRARE